MFALHAASIGWNRRQLDQLAKQMRTRTQI
jgi:hypothetical protein